MEISENLQLILNRIKGVCRRVNRDPSSVTLIGVGKTMPADRIRQAVLCGLRHIGENYVQEAREKKALLSDLDIFWHFIGHLQTNKAKAAVQLFDWIQTVDRMELAKKLDRASLSLRTEPLPVMIEVNIGGEPSKSGVSPDELEGFYDELSALDGLLVKGLMVIPPFFEDPERVRPFFRKARELLERLRLRSKFPERLTELSMGMSHDFEVAIEEGATMVRIGTALFGERKRVG
ncbi:MAG: YggS family pyridoxal phosphate-dependent enzyme [Syntrophobacterales bacterium]|nr:YggS family pyridoxal phosphate-dependent enzyme [Syntrophobacterales bacterium]